MAHWADLVEDLDNEWPEQVKLEFPSDEQSDEQTAFISETKEEEPIVQW